MWHFDTHRFLWLFLSHMFCAKDLCGCLLSLLGFVAIPGLQPFRTGQVMISHGICVSKFSSWIKIETTRPLPCLKQHLYCHHRGGVVLIFSNLPLGWSIWSSMTVVQGDPRQHPRECDEYFQGLRCMIGTSLAISQCWSFMRSPKSAEYAPSPILGVHSIGFYVDPLPGSPEHLCGDWDETYWCVSVGA